VPSRTKASWLSSMLSWSVEIVDHDPEGFLDPMKGGVAEPVAPLQPRAVAQVKACHGIDAYRGLPRQKSFFKMIDSFASP